jgi:hypothetical protein
MTDEPKCQSLRPECICPGMPRPQCDLTEGHRGPHGYPMKVGGWYSWARSTRPVGVAA